MGDNLIHLNWLRKVVRWSGRPAIHYCDPVYFSSLAPFIAGDAIELAPLSAVSVDAVDSWINARGEYENVAFRRNWVWFHLEHFEALARRLEIPNLASRRRHLRFNHPLVPGSPNRMGRFDVLLVNSVPRSGQFPNYDGQAFRGLVSWLLDHGKTVVTTEPTGLCPSTIEAGLSVWDIGRLSIDCGFIASVNTGPLWPTFNIWTEDKPRIVWCQIHEFPLNDRTVTLTRVDQAYDIFRKCFT